MGLSPDQPTTAGQGLLRYRAFAADFRGPFHAVKAIARTSLTLLFRRKLFWTLYGFSAFIFLFYFFGQYLQGFLEQRVSEATVKSGGLFAKTIKPEKLMASLRDALHMDGSADTFGDFIWTEGFIAMVILAFAGSLLVGNDFHHNSLPFYLSKPLSRWHYVAGKCLAIAVVVNMMTTVPALLLYFEYGFVDSWDYYWDSRELLFGILAYGAAITVTFSLLLVVTATWLRRTVPLVMVWTAVFILSPAACGAGSWTASACRRVGGSSTCGTTCICSACGASASRTANSGRARTTQPGYEEASLAVLAAVALCVVYLARRVRAVEVVK